ncbi:MAG: Smr/MutS family protein [Nitrosospira sp.]|nr:Smr/MutS family protein [Nitrosospira sp.]MDW7642885.1 Smr/MutS family protein [Nitrosomonadaceae bacterium]MBI0417267.1 Smr/MutS family protein [Nitrosospira sp.]MCX7182424.1 Smr/MutS family protein [Nitrosospira sp.]MDW7653423.1 Smr/MutS family protein [Nitrosomonadaceae bacterium]
MKQRDSKNLIKPATVTANNEDEFSLFRAAVKDVAPLIMSNKITHTLNSPRPIPRKVSQDIQSTSGDIFSDYIPSEIAIEVGDEWAFLRPGLSHQTLRRLRKNYWGIQARLDLHGFTRDQARQELMMFLDSSSKQGFRCVQVIHGKGLSSKNQEPVLKAKVGGWLAQYKNVLAFCKAGSADGGSGAVLVLLKTSRSKIEI